MGVGTERKRSHEDPGGQAAEVKVDQESQSQGEEFKKAAMLSSGAAKQRARRMNLRNAIGFGKKEVPDDLGENRSSGLGARLQGVKE